MSSSIDNQISQSIRSVNHQIQQEEIAQKRGQQLIAESHHARGKFQIAKDSVLPSSGDNGNELASFKKSGQAKPQLPSATRSFTGFRGASGSEDEGSDNLGLIAIIGEVMALQAKSNSNFWSTMWKQTSESMQMEVKFAPVIGQAVRNAYTAQSLATTAQATESHADGLINLVMFGGAMVMATVMEFKGNGPNEEKLPDQPNTNVQNETDNADNNELGEENQDARRLVNNQESNWKTRGKGILKWLKGVGEAGQKRIIGIFGKGMQSAMAFETLTKGVTGYWVDSKYKAVQAKEQALEGQAQALSKESEQYSQFYGQSFSRSDQMTNAGQQNIDYAMNILKSAADTITGTVTAMFRG